VTDVIGDFELLSVLGIGGAGRVYLARQRSLNRTVAVKVVADTGAEANTLAQLEHDHIVHVFSETVEPELGRRLICMQYVPGTTLGRVITWLRGNREQPMGAAILHAIDALSNGPATLEPALLAERARLERTDAIGATCLIGAALARALAHAHGRGIVHRDVKAANILLTPYGRPLLVDFNIAASRSGDVKTTFGATLRYAAPEQLLAWCGRGSQKLIDARADVYAFGFVLFELLTGSPPFTEPDTDEDVELLLAARAAPLRRVDRPERSARVLERVLHRCLNVEPSRRYASADELAAALDACAALRECERELPPPGPIIAAGERRPMTTLFLAGALPNIIGTVAVYAYNATFPVAQLSAQQLSAFVKATLIYILVAFPVGLALFAWLLWRVSRALWRLEADDADDADVRAARRRLWALQVFPPTLSVGTWLGCIAFVPWFIGTIAAPVTGAVWAHLASALALSGIITLTWGALLLLYVSTRLVLPFVTRDGRVWSGVWSFVPTQLNARAFQLIASGVPPAAAVLLLAFSPDPITSGMRALLIALLCAGVLGLTLATYLAGEATRCAEALGRLRLRVKT
jgi:serine/threonine protein kinase